MAASLRLLINNDYIKGSGTAHHTQLHKTFTHKKKPVEKETQDSKRKLSIPVLNNGKP